MSPGAKAVFLSYASQDAEAARRICDALRAAGVEVWFDQSELRGGDSWDQKIRKQIKECALFVPMISANTQARLEGYFRLEWKLAEDRSHLMARGKPFIVPVAVDDTTERDAQVPDSFLALQWTRLSDGQANANFVRRVQSLLGLEVASVFPRPPEHGASVADRRSIVDETVPTGQRPALPRRAVVVWLSAAMAAAAVVFVVTFLRPGPASESVNSELPTSNSKPADPASTKSVAVLPFVNLGSDSSDEYLGDGLTEELLNALAKVKGLRVPGRSSSFAFKGRTGDDIFRQVGDRLRVNTVLEGSVRRAGNRVRITAQLIKVSDGFHLWSETYDRELTDILGIQIDVAQRVVGALQLQLGMEESRALARKPTNHPEAHRLYLLGRFHLAKSTQASWTTALEHFTRASQIDPNYALAYCGMADVYSVIGGLMMATRDAAEKAQPLARRALELDPGLADAHVSLASHLINASEWLGAETSARRATELNPSLASAYDCRGWLFMHLGRFDEAIAAQRTALELEPASPLLSGNLAWVLFFARRYDEAIAQALRTLELDPNSAEMRRVQGRAYLLKGDPGRALAEFETGRAKDHVSTIDAWIGVAHAAAGNREKAVEALRDLERLATGRYVPPWSRVILHAALGDRQKALDWLEVAAEQWDYAYRTMKVNPHLDLLRSEPRFQALLKKLAVD